jgi:hypothetical protein
MGPRHRGSGDGEEIASRALRGTRPLAFRGQTA